jgi:hypothetical protein
MDRERSVPIFLIIREAASNDSVQGIPGIQCGKWQDGAFATHDPAAGVFDPASFSVALGTFLSDT